MGELTDLGTYIGKIKTEFAMNFAFLYGFYIVKSNFQGFGGNQLNTCI